MSSDHYTRKWHEVLRKLELIINTDLDYQVTKSRDQKECRIVQLMSEVLGGYTAVYSEAVECLRQNLQLQKTGDIYAVVYAVCERVMELKNCLSKLQKSNMQFITRGLVDMKLTTDQTELKDIPVRIRRPAAVQAAIDKVWIKVQELKKTLEEEERERQRQLEEDSKPIDFGLWGEEVVEEVKKTVKIDEGTKMRKIITSQERCRQVIVQNIQSKQRREMWTKVLQGTDKPLPRKEIQVKAAQIIQKYIRAYFETKRKRITNCRRDDLLGLRMCYKPSEEEKKKSEQITERREIFYKKYEEEWKTSYEQLRVNCLKKFSDPIKEDYRDEIRDWFWKWYKEAWFFTDIPKANCGGSTLILTGVVPTPSEWKDLNEAYLTKQKSNKGKTSEQLQQEKKAAAKAKLLEKKVEDMKKKQQEKLLQKAMKNPKMHPGFMYPLSNKTEKILDAIKQFHANWDDLEANERKEVKEKYIKELDKDTAWAAVKKQLRPSVDDDMREELRKLKTALKKDYAVFEEEWPKDTVPLKFPKIRKQKPIKTAILEHVFSKMVDLTMKGIMKQCPKTELKDFKGEPNFAGDDLRCEFRQAFPYAGETRSLWWEQCKAMAQGLQKVLLVGPKASGKTLLVYAMATVNNAVLFELEVNPALFPDMETKEVNALINSIAACAKAAQPAIIYLKYVHRLYYRKVPPNEPSLDTNILNTYLKKLIRKFSKTDKITIIGSCQNPWLLKSASLLKQFPTVVMMPNTTYTTTVQILREWALNNRIVPPELDLSSLAQLLQGYQFGYLTQKLQDFLSADRIVRIAVHGLRPQEILEFILADEETKVEYDKYLKWYTEKTNWGQAEKKHLEEQLEFEAVLKKYQEKGRKRAAASAASSAASSIAGDSVHGKGL